MQPTPPPEHFEMSPSSPTPKFTFTDSSGQPLSPESAESSRATSYDKESEDDISAEQTQGLLSGDDEEKQQPRSGAAPPTTNTQDGAEYSVSTSTKLLCLGLYFTVNLTLTLYNKAVLGKFAFPWLLTTLHTSFASLGCYILMMCGYMKLTRLSRQENYTLIAFSVLFTINIAISNVSLAMVSVPFHQIARSTCPVVTILIYRWFYGRAYATATYMALVPIVAGVALSTYGDYYFSILGASLTFLGVLLAAVKTVATNRLLTGNLKLPALELLMRMSPLAAIQSIFYAYLTGEFDHFITFVREDHMTPSLGLILLGNGILAFVLNVTSFQTNKLAGALTLSVCGNLKQCLTILLGVLLFNVHVGLLNGAGMLVTLGGAAWYSKVELDVKKRPAVVG
ncbi:hypothetical protein MBLNU459_g1403t1 [Dothideomycetes sp. NU459]